MQQIIFYTKLSGVKQAMPALGMARSRQTYFVIARHLNINNFRTYFSTIYHRPVVLNIILFNPFFRFLKPLYRPLQVLFKKMIS